MTADRLPLAAPRQTAPAAAPTLPWWAHAAAPALITAVVGYLARGLWGWTYDDAYIIYRYARNFAAGLGLVYNPGEPYLGSSSAGYTLLLALLHWAAPALDFPALGSAVSAVGFWTAGALLWSLGVRTRALPAGLLAALFTVANPVLVESWGGEMALLLPLVFGAVLCYARGWGAATGALLGLATLTRQDSLVLVALLGAHYAWTRRRVPWRSIAAFALVTAPWVAYSWLFFGSPIPGTLEAKIAQGQAGWPFFLSGALDWMGKRLGDGPARPIALALLVAGAAALGWDLWRRRAVAPWLLIRRLGRPVRRRLHGPAGRLLQLVRRAARRGRRHPHCLGRGRGGAAGRRGGRPAVPRRAPAGRGRRGCGGGRAAALAAGAAVELQHQLCRHAPRE